MNVYNMDKESFETNMNRAKDVLLNALHREGKITTEVLEDYTSEVSIIIKKPSLFNQYWSKFWKVEEQEEQFILVRNLSIRAPESNVIKLKDDL